MPMAYRVIPHHQLSVTVVEGRVDADDLRALAGRQASDPVWHAATRMLTDNTRAIVDEVSADTIAEFAALYDDMRGSDPPCRDAIVAAQSFSLSRRFANERPRRAAVTTIVFSELATACMWLGVDYVEVSETVMSLRSDSNSSSD
jgi:hypothetical protein